MVFLGITLFLLYYIFTLLGGQSKLMEMLQKWSKENMLLACSMYLILVPVVNIIPGISSMFFITLANMMLNDKTTLGMFHSFLLADAGIILSSTLLFLLGRWFGKKLLGWVIGKEDFDKAEYLLTTGGKACLPFFYLLPFFPDDTICFVCGCTKMSFMFNFINVILFRSVGVLTICFLGTDFFDYKSFTWYQWVGIVIALIIFLIVLFFIIRAIYRHLRKKQEGLIYTLTNGLQVDKKNDAK